ncbi:MAG: hypothetical protein Q9225_008044 [Loekoesia sp. 1 TL-2023]
MGWLWTSKTTDEPPRHSHSSEEIPTDSAPAPPDNGPLHNPTTADLPSTHHHEPDAELQSLLASLETPQKPNGASTDPYDISQNTAAGPTTSDSQLITPSTLYPTEMSCRSAFDTAFYCQSLGGQFNNIYRYGTFRDCREQWKQFWFCMRTNRGFLGDEERGRRIMDHYKLRETKYRVGPSSEDVWKPRAKMVENAFDGDLEADERAARAEREKAQAETS